MTINLTQLQAAVDFTVAHETPWSRDIDDNWGIHLQDPAPWNRLLGPVHPRGPVSGVVRVGGKPIIEWGEPNRADLTFSIAKTYLALLAGVALDSGLLPNLDEPVRIKVPGIGFEEAHNQSITWLQLLQQTSEWEGDCFGIPDTVDRYRHLQYQPAREGGKKGDARPLQTPGSFWEYNDIRVNRLSLALLRRFGRSLRDVFAERIMAPIGASNDWRWVGYRNSIVSVVGKDIESVSGGGHWGGGVFIHAEDQVLVGQLMLADGIWNGRRLLPKGWVAAMLEPCPVKPDYGLLWWLNPDGCFQATASPESYFALGAGGNITWIDPAHDIVAVLRWIDMAALPEWIGMATQAIRR